MSGLAAVRRPVPGDSRAESVAVLIAKAVIEQSGLNRFQPRTILSSEALLTDALDVDGAPLTRPHVTARQIERLCRGTEG